ncbi:single-stranded DNA-binding protein [Litorilituus lipolyticus]|nr:single-stranded DNA-binding protein [Litorilituus lipolyticus]
MQNIPAASPQMCSVTLLGNLVAKPDIRYRTNPVVAVTEITLATHSKWLDKKTNQFKEWTSFHHVKVEGQLVEQALLHANKGDIILIHGYLNNMKAKSEHGEHPPIVHANFVQGFKKGFTESINQIHCSATLLTHPQQMLTEHNKVFCSANIAIDQRIYSPEKQDWLTIKVERPIHAWGKQAQYFAEHAQLNQQLMVEGKLSYSSNKLQFIEVNKLHLFNI